MIISVLILITVCSTSITAMDGNVTTDNVNVRSGPGTDYEVIGQVHQNTKITIIDELGDWYKVKASNVEGWVTKEFVQAFDSSYDSYIQTDSHNAVIQVREEPSLLAEVKGTLENGQTYPIVQEKNNWYEIQLSTDTTGWVASWIVAKHTNKPDQQQLEASTANMLKNKVIVVDAGHGGDDTGTISATGDYEKYLTIRTGQLLAKKLERLGAIPILTRNHDLFLPLENRVAYSYAHQADAFLSIHYNSAPEFPDVHGIGTYYYYDPYYSLANEIQKEIIQATGFKNREVKEGNYFVIRENIRPAVLIELGFLSNREEEKNVKTNTFQEEATSGIIRGLTNYFQMME